MKTPVLIAWNDYGYSGSVEVSIDIGYETSKVSVYPTFTSGPILSKLLDKELPDVTLWKGSGRTWGGETYYYHMGKTLAPNKKWWAWIWARPIYAVYKVYYCSVTRSYIRDDVEAVITDVLTDGKQIIGGCNDGFPHKYIMESFYNGTEEINLKIPDTMLSDGWLSPGEYISFPLIFQHYDECDVDFEVGIPLGALLAYGIAVALGVPTGGTTFIVATAFAASFQVYLSAEGSSIEIWGGITDHGDDSSIPNDYDVSEKVYIRISRYRYQYLHRECFLFWCTDCYYDVPAGIYFRFW